VDVVAPAATVTDGGTPTPRCCLIDLPQALPPGRTVRVILFEWWMCRYHREWRQKWGTTNGFTVSGGLVHTVKVAEMSTVVALTKKS